MKIKTTYALIAILLICFLSGLVVPNVQAVDNTNPKIAEGSGFNIYLAGQGSIMFQHPDGSFFDTQFLLIEVLDGTWNGTDCQLYMTKRGGSLYFVSANNSHLQIYSSGATQLSIDGMEYQKITTTTWNATLTDGAAVQISWGYPLDLPHEANFMFWIGLSGIIMLVCGIMLSAYAFRHYTIFTLDDKETIWDKEILPFCILLLLGGFCLIIAWLFSGGA